MAIDGGKFEADKKALGKKAKERKGEILTLDLKEIIPDYLSSNKIPRGIRMGVNRAFDSYRLCPAGYDVTSNVTNAADHGRMTMIIRCGKPGRNP